MGVAHEFTSEEARVAGRKGGTAVARNKAHMSKIGKLGGLASRVRAPEDDGDERDRS